MARGKHSSRTFGRGWTVGLILVATVTVLGGGTAVAAFRYDRASATRILPGVSIDGVDVSGMTRDQAIRAITAKAEVSLGVELDVEVAGSTLRTTPAALGTHADVEGAVTRALAVADTVSLLSRVYHRIADKPIPTAIPLAYAYDEQAIRAFVERAGLDVARPAVDAAIRLVDEQLVIRHSQTGEALNVAAGVARVKTALRQQAAGATLPVTIVEPATTAATLGKTIVVDLSENTLSLYRGLKIEKQYPVATAAPGYTTPVGTWKVVAKAENPTWYNPAPDGWGAGEPLVIPPGPGNPLGTRALYLNAPGIRIHGTYASYSIGTYASHGCIRMYISDSEELFQLVSVGTKVIIKP